jgi:hypothetical protein
MSEGKAELFGGIVLIFNQAKNITILKSNNASNTT